MQRLGAGTIGVLAVILIGLVQLADGALSTGITVDEPTHVARTATWLEHGWYVQGELLVAGKPDPANELASPFIYGPAFSGLAHLANVALGNESMDGISSSIAAFKARHLTVAALSLLAVAAVAAIVWSLTGLWRFGLWAAAALLAIPSWLGQSFFNIKDIPVASGYTLFTAGLVLALATKPNQSASRVWRALLPAALIAAGVFLAVGTRLAMWAPLFASVLTYGALRIGQWRRAGDGWRRDQDGAVLAGGALGLVATAAIYPNAFSTPRTLLTHSLSDAAGYPNQTLTLTAGRLLPEHPPWWYLPTWFGARLPLLIAGLAILGAIVALLALTTRRRAAGKSIWERPEVALLLVLQQALLLPLISICGGATMYDAERQHLYVFPALAVLAGVGAAAAWRWVRRRGRARAWRPACAVLLSMALVVPMAEQALLFPFNYVYVNPVAGVRGVNGEWDTDYWAASSKEALSHVPDSAWLLCAGSLERESDPDAKPEFGDCAQAHRQPFLDQRDIDGSPADNREDPWVIASTRARNRPPGYCREVADVTRWLRGEEVKMSYVLRCDRERVLAAMGEGPASQAARTR